MKEEIPVHLLCHCDDLAETMCLVLHSRNPSNNSFVRESLSKMIQLIKKTKLEGAFDGRCYHCRSEEIAMQQFLEIILLLI